MTEQQIPEVVEHDDRSELAHDSDGTTWWQESVVVAWHDDAAGLGGIVRIGHEPHFEGGIAVVTGGVVTDEGTSFRRNAAAPLTDADRPELGFGGLGGAWRIEYDGRARLRAQEDGLEVDLVVEDFYPRVDFFPKSAGSLVDEFASNHFETSGRITGTVVLDGREHAIDGLCHRDHSWGVRRWETILNHRWTPVVFGPDLSLGTIVWHAVDGSLGGYGYVVRDGVVTRTSDVHVGVRIEADGITSRAGTATLVLPDGERLVVDLRAGEGLLNEHHDVAWIDAIGRAELDGRVGFGDLEISTNPRAGRGPITTYLGGRTDEGLRRASSTTAA
jgi:hypothetical protein